MKISKTSWHYRMLSKMDMLPKEPSLCPYFRNLIFSLAIITLSSAVVIGILGVMLSPIVHFLSIFTVSAKVLEAAAVLWFCCGILIIAIPAAIWGIERSFRRDKKNKEPTIVGQWIKAKKEKICPMIDFTE